MGSQKAQELAGPQGRAGAWLPSSTLVLGTLGDEICSMEAIRVRPVSDEHLSSCSPGEGKKTSPQLRIGERRL